MKPVAMVAVDTDRDKLRIQKLTGRTRGAKEQDRLKVGGASPKSARAAEKPKESPVIQRSQSLMNFKSVLFIVHTMMHDDVMKCSIYSLYNYVIGKGLMGVKVNCK